MATRQVDYATLLSQLLDSGYYSTINPVVRSLARWEQGAIGARLRQLEIEIERLEADDERLNANNLIFRDLVRDVREVMDDQTRRLIEAVAPDLNEQGIIAGEQWFTQTTNPTGLGISFNRPDPEAIRALVDRLQSDAWRDKITGYADDVADTLQNTIIRGIVLGKNPRTTARDIRRFMDTYPRYRAETLMRTMQLTAYREANAANVVANADIIEVQIRIAALDDRTCLACVSLHGTELAVGERVDDHHNGRCTSVAIVKGRPREIETGDDWFARQTEDRQRQIAGNANYEALKAGKVKLSDFVKPYEDPVYGQMVREASLKDILGGRAKDFYTQRAPRISTRPVPPPRPKAGRDIDRISETERGIINQQFESSFIYDKDGNLLSRFDGSKDRIDIDVDTLQRATGGTLTHNHPSGSSFSPEDVMIAHGYNLSELRVVGTNPAGRRVLYSIRPTENGWSSVNIDELTANAESRFNVVLKQYRKRIAEGMDKEEAYANVWHDVWRSNIRTGNYEYSRTFLDD